LPISGDELSLLHRVNLSSDRLGTRREKGPEEERPASYGEIDHGSQHARSAKSEEFDKRPAVNAAPTIAPMTLAR
jgi:hypothetical protein